MTVSPRCRAHHMEFPANALPHVFKAFIADPQFALVSHRGFLLWLRNLFGVSYQERVSLLQILLSLHIRAGLGA
jgi:hypothetical protein